jgi:hypothetical protein
MQQRAARAPLRNRNLRRQEMCRNSGLPCAILTSIKEPHGHSIKQAAANVTPNLMRNLE